MPRIERLPEDLIDKIAAGEVVERPASVVKELLENALDARARSITVEIEAGGKGLIRVRDDGEGMGRADAELALERHATSKLRDLSGLQSITTHGFRGEALPSIASVSQLTLTTRDDSGPAGTEVEVRHGRRLHVRDAGHPRGTTVEVRDLFGGVPARRKFLRSDPSEAAQVAEATTLLALAHPATGFTLTSGGRTILQAPPVDGLAARIYQVFGGSFLEDLVPVEGGEGWVGVRGFLWRPDRPGPRRPSLRLFVNGRAVRDRALSKAVAEAYRAAGAADPRGAAILFVEVPPSMVDVNVHPAKTEVRFADPRTVWAAVERAAREALSSGTRRPPRAEVPAAAPRAEGAWGVAEGGPAAAGLPLERGPTGARGAPLLDAGAPTVLGQYRNTYAVATDGEDLILVDQHTAHERVRFETLLDRLSRRAVESQVLLSPQVVTLPPELHPLIEAHQEPLRDLGFEVEAFGGHSARVRAIPAMLGARDPGPALEDILRDLREREATDWIVSGVRDRLAATLACHSAVRAGTPLSLEKMGAIVRDLALCAHPTLCPHGRPTLVRIPREDVSRWFGRAGWTRQ